MTQIKDKNQHRLNSSLEAQSLIKYVKLWKPNSIKILLLVLTLSIRHQMHII